MGLDIYLSSPGVGKTEYGGTLDLDSATYPEHICKRNYLRSSYNGSGYNSVVGNLLGLDWYWVFAPAGAGRDEYRLTPTKAQLRECRERAVQQVADLAAAAGIGVEFYASAPARPHDGIIASDEDAIAAYRKQAAEDAARTDTFMGHSNSNSVGYWFLADESLTVKAIIPGKGFMGAGAYVVFDIDPTFYRQAAELVVEFIDYALSQRRPVISWSS